MLLNHLWHKIVNYKEFSIYNLTFIILGIFVVFLMISFRDISIAKIESSVVFYDKTVLISTNVSSISYPQGFMFDDSEIDEVKLKYDFLTISKSTEISSSVRQNISFSAVTPDFIDTGVATFDYRYSKVIAEKVDLLFGMIWGENSTNPVVVIDQTTAYNVFGYYNAVGNILETSIGDLTIIGVVTDTMARNQLIQNNIDAGQSIDEYIFSTSAYIPYSYFELISTASFSPDNYLISDNNLSNLDLKNSIIEYLNVRDANILVSRFDLIQREIMDNETYFKVITSITSVLIVLGTINLINVSSFFFSIFKRNNAIYRVVGATRGKIIVFSLLEGLMTSIIGSVAAILLVFLTIFISSLIMNNLAYINVLSLLKFSLLIIGIVVVMICIINLFISLIYTKKHFYNELKDIDI
jgi:ABC-type antimicrobial peptide transport system permease subunit